MSVTISGNVRARGNNGINGQNAPGGGGGNDHAAGGGGGGSGGGVLIQGGDVTISGTVDVSGGNGGNGGTGTGDSGKAGGGGGGAGSGGRIMIYYTSLSVTGAITYGGGSGGVAGEPTGGVTQPGNSGSIGTYNTEQLTDTIPPVISSVNATAITHNSSIINWTTNEASDSVVKYGTVSGSYAFVVSDAALNTSHTIQLKDLTPDTTYYYVVNSTDMFNNSAQSTEYGFTTSSLGPYYWKSFSIPENVSKIACTVIWTGLYDSSGVTVTLISPSNVSYNEFGSGVTTRRKVTETVIPLPGLANYNITRYDGITRLSVFSPSSGTWTLKVVDTNVTSFEADYELS